MVDIETTGLDPNKNAIIQIGALPFDLNIMAKGSKAFKMSLTIPSDREWMPSTKEWWLKTNPDLLKDITSKSENFIVVMSRFREYVKSFNDEIRFWSNHPFDWNFLNNYFVSYGVPRPYKYDAFRDLDTYIVAIVGENNIKKYKPIPKEELEHDALYDCMLQIDWLFESIKNKG